MLHVKMPTKRQKEKSKQNQIKLNANKKHSTFKKLSSTQLQ